MGQLVGVKYNYMYVVQYYMEKDSEDGCPVCGKGYAVKVSHHTVSDMIIGIEDKDYELHTHNNVEYLHKRD